MFFDLQRASMLKRISALILDLILLLILATGGGTIVSSVVGYDKQFEKVKSIYEKYELEYGVSLELTESEVNALLPERRAAYEAAWKAADADTEMNAAYSLLINLQLVIISLGILIAYIGLELVVPLLFKNGQTVGKKVFGLCVMQTDQTKIKPIMLVVRTFLGKYTIETMVPVLIVYMVFYNMIGIVGPIILCLLLLLQLAMLIITKTNSAIHDILAGTVVVDAKSQKIFDNLEALEAYKKKIEQNTNEKGYV